MIISTVAIAGALGAGTVGASLKAYREQKRKKEYHWPYALIKIKKNKQVPLHKRRATLAGQKQEVSAVPSAAEPSTAERKADRYLALSGISLALSTTGIYYAPLALMSVPFLLMILSPVVKRGYNLVIKEKKVGMALVDVLGIAGPVIEGNFVLASVFGVLYHTSRKLLIKTEDHSRKSLRDIFSEQPRFIWVMQDGVEIELPFENVQVGDTVVVDAGQTIAVDGLIIEGMARIDQRQLTGESQPVEKGIGDKVLASTFLLSGRIYIQVESAGSETVAAEIGDILNRTTDFKSSIESRGEKIVEQGARPTLLFAGLAWRLLGIDSAFAILLCGFGYHMRYTAPISVLNFLRMASEDGILIKDGRSLELLSQIDTVVFDKTGTLTCEVPTIGQIYCDGLGENELLSITAAAEYKQSHPIALAITKEARMRELTLPPINDANYEIGYGIKVSLQPMQSREGSPPTAERLVYVGSGRFMESEGISIPAKYKKIEADCHLKGHSLVYVAIDNQLSGAIELLPTIRPEVKQITKALRQRGISMVIISGDHQKPTRKLAESLGIEHYFAEVLPQDKASLVEQLQEDGKSVCFVGDGINDSIALKKAKVSISLRGASTVATDSAGIILMDGTLNKLIRLLDIANQLDTNLTRSTIMTIVPGVICVGGVFFFHLGLAGSLIMYKLSLAASVGNAMLPLIQAKKPPFLEAPID
jgi:Cu2+-exporting ATPase